MLKRILLFLILLLNKNFYAQAEDPSLALYNKGVAASQKNQFARADSFYTLSLRILPHPDTYFNRAMVRLKLNNKTGYYEDLLAAGILGDQEAKNLFNTHTLKADTLRFFTTSVEYNLDSIINDFSYIIYTLQDIAERLELKYDHQNKLLNLSWCKEILPKENVKEEVAEYKGGLAAMSTFIKRNLIYPKEAMEKGIGGKVFLKFTIDPNGCIKHIAVIKSMQNCVVCDKETIRLLNLMPRWKPARLKGKAVNCYFTLPFTFKAQ